MNYNIEIEKKGTNCKSLQWNNFLKGLRLGIPVALGYIPVSFTFGLLAIRGGMSVWVAVLISITNFTSAGQFAGTNLILAGAPIYEIGLAAFIINIRYSLMSLSLSQKIEKHMPKPHKFLWGFGVTDETFSIASMEEGRLSSQYLFGLSLLPYFGWLTGTLLGAVSCKMLSTMLQNAMGIALYAMFIALVIPACRKSLAAAMVCGTAVIISSCFKYVPFLSNVSSGWVIITATIVACSLGAILFPRKEE